MNDQPPVTMMHESWEPPPELAGPTPRRIQWRVVGIVNIALIVVLFFIGFGILGATLRSADEGKRLKEEGRITDATVTRTWSESGGRSMNYKVAYEFSVEGKTQTGESGIAQRRWKELHVGSHTPVKYVPGQPDYNQLSLAYVTPTSYWVPLAVFVLWIFMLALAIPPVRKERFLLKYGQAAPGMITSTKATSGGRTPKYGYIIKYEFQLSDGTIVNGKTRRDVARNRDEVTVLYDPKHPRRNDIYPTKMARIKS